ncbi:MAG: hypothetical protein H6669_17630 [Ardenticatenaceae bacterium]|nr:hypothetical protein [Ardenticatenaceae bacterium]
MWNRSFIDNLLWRRESREAGSPSPQVLEQADLLNVLRKPPDGLGRRCWVRLAGWFLAARTKGGASAEPCWVRGYPAGGFG